MNDEREFRCEVSADDCFDGKIKFSSDKASLRGLYFYSNAILVNEIFKIAKSGEEPRDILNTTSSLEKHIEANCKIISDDDWTFSLFYFGSGRFLEYVFKKASELKSFYQLKNDLNQTIKSYYSDLDTKGYKTYSLDNYFSSLSSFKCNR